MARHIPLPSFWSTKRSKAITAAAAGTLTLAAAVSAIAITVPSSPSPSQASPAPATANAAFLTRIGQQSEQAPQSDALSGIQQAILLKQRVVQAQRSEQIAAEKAAALAAMRRAAAARAAAAAAARAAAARVAAQQVAAQQAAAAQSAAQAQPTQQAQPVQQAVVTVSSGSPEQIAEQMLSQYGWSASEFSCLQPLWQRESGWNVTAQNPSSGAYGIPQALPGSQMASAGPNWATDAATQIRWGLTYIKGRYGSPCGAWAHEVADGWY